jgi:hypothetical protein
VVRCGSKSEYQKNLDLKKIRLRTQNMMIAIVNIIGVGLYDHFMSTIIFTFMMNKIFIRAPKSRRKVASALRRPQFGFAKHDSCTTVVVCFISQERWANRKYKVTILRPLYLSFVIILQILQDFN